MTTNRPPLTLIYTGPSMNRTLAAGDLLHVVPCEVSRLRRGDVIVFSPDGRGPAVAHRVVSVGKEGVRTRGDNNRDLDPELLQERDIVGKVVAAERKRKIRRIHGGFAGNLVAATMRARRFLMAVLARSFRAPYRWLAASGHVQKSLPCAMRPKVVTFRRQTGVELQLMMGSRTIGVLRPGAQLWIIRPPYRLFVDESALPSWKDPSVGALSDR